MTGSPLLGPSVGGRFSPRVLGERALPLARPPSGCLPSPPGRPSPEGPTCLLCPRADTACASSPPPPQGELPGAFCGSPGPRLPASPRTALVWPPRLRTRPGPCGPSCSMAFLLFPQASTMGPHPGLPPVGVAETEPQVGSFKASNGNSRPSAQNRGLRAVRWLPFRELGWRLQKPAEALLRAVEHSTGAVEETGLGHNGSAVSCVPGHLQHFVGKGRCVRCQLTLSLRSQPRRRGGSSEQIQVSVSCGPHFPSAPGLTWEPVPPSLPQADTEI